MGNDKLDLRRHVQQIAEDHTLLKLEELGIDATPQGYHSRNDLIVNGHIHIEVKGSRWVAHKVSKGRYQFNTRQKADFYILYCVGTWGDAFIIPGNAIGNRHNIAIWSQDPIAYQGQWSKYWNRWDLIPCRPAQRVREIDKCYTCGGGAKESAHGQWTCAYCGDTWDTFYIPPDIP